MTNQLYPSISELRSAIPKELFVKNEVLFLKSVVTDIMYVYAMYRIGLWIPQQWEYSLLWILYFVAQGTLATGLWVLGHECGHGAFSSSEWKNDILGFFVHSFLLVPYFSWKQSHAVHHANTGHIDRDETHVPNKYKPNSKPNLLQSCNTLYGVFVLLFGWFLYLLFGVTGGDAYKPSSHFVFPNKLIPSSLFVQGVMSMLGLIGMAGLLYMYSLATSTLNVLLMYVGPYLVVNGWLVLYTFLQHVREDIPRYGDEEWKYVKGALCTVDRPAYGGLIHSLHHHIGDSHVVHHLFSQIPHYHAKYATYLVKQYLSSKEEYKNLYIEDHTPIVKAFFSSTKLHFMKFNESLRQWNFVTSY